MNISKFERFCIRYSIIISILLYAVAIFSYSASDSFSVKTTVIIVCIVIKSFFALVKNRPHITATKLYNDDLDPKSAVSLTEELLKLQKRDELFEKQQNYNDLFEYYLSLGDTEKVIELYTEIKRKNKKIDKSYDLQLRLFLCTAYLNHGEKYLYDQEMHIIQPQLAKSKTARRLLKDQFKGVKLLEESLYGNNDPRFEENVFEFLYKIKPNGKIGNKKPSDIQKISAYGLLFNFYKSNGNSEKATEYARKSAEICNEQFIVYRIAKEYLENADRSN